MRAKGRGEVVAVRDLFAKYKNTLIAPQKTVEMEVMRVVGELFGVKLEEKQVKYTPSSRTLVFLAPSIIKQELKTKEKQILDELKKRLGAKNSPTTIL